MRRRSGSTRRGLGLGMALAWAAFAAATAGASGVPVVAEMTLRNGDWTPLPEAEMKAAAGDAALEELSSVGALRLVDASSGANAGSLAMELALIGPAETATMTITLQLPDRPTCVSTASISVRRLDFAGIHQAFRHVGQESARRLAARLRALDLAPAAVSNAAALPNDETQQAHWDEAQSAKHALDFERARVLLERVAAADGAGTERLRALAQDELRYGLPVFQAKQALLDASQPLGDVSQRARYFAHAEHLYRQILAENPNDAARIQEAQRALDELAVARRALRQALQANTIARLMPLRMQLAEALASEGECPDAEQVGRWLSDLSPGLELRRAPHHGPATSYVLAEEDGTFEVELVCDRGIRIQSPPARPR